MWSSVIALSVRCQEIARSEAQYQAFLAIVNSQIFFFKFSYFRSLKYRLYFSEGKATSS